MHNCIIIIILIGVVFSDCRTGKSALENYENESKIILRNDDVQLKFYHFSDDSTSLFLKIKNSELLASRKKNSKELTTSISGEMLLFDYQLNKAIDTVLFKANGRTSNDEHYFYFYSINFPLKDLNFYNYRLILKDKNRSTQCTINGTINKTSELIRENILLVQGGNTHPNFDLLINNKSSYSAVSERLDLTQTEFWFRTANGSLPPPPFSTSKEDLPEMSEFEILTLPVNKNELILNNFSLGDLLLKKGSLGLSILVRPNKYPELTSISEMIYPLRYISARKEFERLKTNSNHRSGLERFWLDCGESQERARELMAEFYDRVQTANLNFSSYKSGWKTDRGMIFIVFGTPTKITLDKASEIWVYGDKDDLGSVNFIFNKIKTSFSDNHYELERNSIYKSEWAQKVSAWRNGRIYN
ncbi:MAG: GWxTD domain-containing protein [Flavobacteriales bacterium]